MLNAFIRLIKLGLFLVPLLVAIVECHDEDEDEDKSPTIHAVIPESTTPQPEPGRLVVDLLDYPTVANLNSLSAITGYQLNWVHPESHDEGLTYVDTNNMQETYNLLANHPLVEMVEPSMRMYAMGFGINNSYPDDPLYPKQWHLDAMGAPYGWRHTPAGKDVVVAVADTGVTVVRDLQDTKVLAGESFVDDAPVDRQGHGTHVSGSVAQSTNNGVGTAGVAPAATILPVKVLTDAGYGTTEGIAAGIDWAVDNGAQVINLSLGGPYSKVIHKAIKQADEAGVIVVAACGNSRASSCDYPGGLKETIGVSATGPEGKLSFYSSYGKGVDIAAPGGDQSKKYGQEGGVLQATIDGGYDYYQGTSMATPHVAGAAAVLLSTGLTPEQVKDILLSSAREDDQTKFGAGHLDLEAAIKSSPANPIGAAHQHAGLFVVAGLLALVISVWSETSRQFMVKTAVASAILGGGLWFVAEIPFFTGVIANLIATPLLEWPNVLLWPGAAGFPLWASCALPMLFGFVAGMNQYTRPIAAGLCFGFAANLIWAAVGGTLAIWAIPTAFSTLWLTVHGLSCVFMGLALAGAQTLEEAHDV